MSHLDRRNILRGLGAGLALPFLASARHGLPGLETLGQLGTQTGTGSEPEIDQAKRRLVYVYVPNGIHMADWTPSTTGREFELPFLLEPLAPFREYLSVCSGLSQNNARSLGDGPGDHARAAAVFLTGVHPLKTDGQVRLGPSADQLAARATGGSLPFRSLELGTERGGNAGQCDSGYSCAYSSNLSWQNETTPATKEVRPRLVFERLFQGGRSAGDERARQERLALRKSVIDFVREDAKRLRLELGSEDRVKLDEYFSGVRELERRIQVAENDRGCDLPDNTRAPGVPANYGERLRLMMDLIVLALQTDRTRIVTLLAANEGSNRTYREIGLRDGHHELTHHRGDAEKIGHVREINRYHTEQLAYFLGKLATVREGEGNLLDSVQLVYGSGISDGNRHNHDDLPILLIGRGAGALHPGQHMQSEPGTPLNNLHLRLVQNMGTRIEAFGDSNGTLAGV